MPSTAYRFSCNTQEDHDLIKWLDGFPSRERGLVVKKALRLYMRNAEMTTADKLERMEDQLARVLREIVAIKRNGFSVTTSLETDTLANKDIDEITANILNLLN